MTRWLLVIVVLGVCAVPFVLRAQPVDCAARFATVQAEATAIQADANRVNTRSRAAQINALKARITAFVTSLTAFGASGCVAVTPPPSPATLLISCPTSQAVISSVPLAVSFPPATTTGGLAPVNVSAVPASGSTFPVGNTLVTATATSADGQKASCQFTVAVNPAPVPPSPSDRILYDSFEYSAQTCGEFQAQSPWKGPCKEQEPRNTIATVTSAVGCPTPFPSGSRALKFVLNGTAGQTGTYLSPTNTESSANDNYLPGDVWFQFAICIPHAGSELSITGLQKFIYPCNGTYPCHTHKWLGYFCSGRTYAPHFASPFGDPTKGEMFLCQRDAEGGSVVDYAPARSDGDQGDLGQQDLSQWVKPNVWNVVRLRFNTSQANAGQWHGWIRQFQSQTFTKVAEWIGGTTPNFTWTTTAGGHRGFRLLPQFSSDAWIYLDDFTVARTAAALP